MCGRFALSKLPAELIEEFEIHTGKTLPILPADWNITPTRDIYIVRNESENKRDLAIASWGIIAPWSKDSDAAIKSQSQAINARSETVDQKPTFRSAFRSRRCLIPADGYYEWATEMGPYSPKQPFYISADISTDSVIGKSQSLAFAGIWDRWIAPDGTVRDSAAIITRPAVEFLATVHSRMPTFLPRDRWDQWLDRSVQDVDEIRAMMELESPAIGLKAVPVASLVNSIRNNGPELIAPIELGEPQTLF
jgi:putative SOS response-associated peptidase YedK